MPPVLQNSALLYLLEMHSDFPLTVGVAASFSLLTLGCSLSLLLVKSCVYVPDKMDGGDLFSSVHIQIIGKLVEDCSINNLNEKIRLSSLKFLLAFA